MRRLLTLIIIVIVPIISSGRWLYWHDYQPYSSVWREEAGDGWGVRFDPPYTCGYIEKVRFCVTNPPGNYTWDGFWMELWTYNPGADVPGARVEDFGDGGRLFISYDQGGWVEAVGIHYFWKTTAPFVIVLIQPGDEPNCDAVYVDTPQTDPNPNFSYFGGEWFFFTLKNGDFLVSVWFTNYTAVDTESLGRIKSLYR